MVALSLCITFMCFPIAIRIFTAIFEAHLSTHIIVPHRRAITQYNPVQKNPPNTCILTSRKITPPAMSGNRTTVLMVARCPNIVMRGSKRGAKNRLDINKPKKTHTAATDLLVCVLQETIVPLVCGNPGSTLG